MDRSADSTASLAEGSPAAKGRKNRRKIRTTESEGADSPNVRNSWNPSADCDGISAQERMMALQEEPHFLLEGDARAQIMREFPASFYKSTAWIPPPSGWNPK